MTLGTPTLLTSGSSTTDSTTYTTASVTLTAGRLYTLHIDAGLVGVASSVPAITGNQSGNWTLEQHLATPNDAVTESVFTVRPASTTVGTITFTYPLVQSNITWRIYEVTGTNPYVVQSKAAAGTLTNFGVTLDAAPAATSLVISCYAYNAASSQTLTVPSGFTAISTRLNVTSPTIAMWAAYDAASAPTTHNWTTGNSSGKVIVALEIAEQAGQNLTENPSDAEGLTDLTVVSQAMAALLADPQALSDAAIASVGLGVPVADPMGLTDSTTLALTKELAAGDAEGLTDSASLVQGHGVRPTDVAGLTDALSTKQDHRLTTTDALGLSDSTVVSLGDADSVTDPLGLSDAASLSMVKQVAATDAENLNDAASLSVGYGVRPTDAEGLVDNAVVSVGRTQSSTDALGLADSAVLAVGHGVRPTDLLGLADSSTLQQNHGAYATDSTGLTDSVTVALIGAGSVNQTDTEGLTDTVVLAMQHVRTVADSAGLSDSTVVSEGHRVNPVDALGLADSALVSRALGANPVDSMGITDTNRTLVQSMVLNVAEAMGISDGASVDLAGAVSEAVGDALGLSDSAVVTLFGLIAVAVGDVMNLTDVATRRMTLAALPTDVAALSDLVVASQRYALGSLDTLGITDSVTVSLGAELVFDELIGLFDVAVPEDVLPFTPATEAAAEWAPGFAGGVATLDLDSGAAITISRGDASIEL